MRRVLTADARTGRAFKVFTICITVVTMLLASLVAVNFTAPDAEAQGAPYSGPITQSTGPAYFGPAPNPIPYCESPTYFDPFPENVNPVGRLDVGGSAAVTTDNLTMTFQITAEGNPGTQYPGFFGPGTEGPDTDQPKGVEMAEGDAATITLSQPLFYSQWIFTDVDQPGEGFAVTPNWTVEGEAAAFGGDADFIFSGSSGTLVNLDDSDGDGHASESIAGRVQVDFLGAVRGINIARTFPSSGQSGFAVGGGCEAAGTAKQVVSGPTWNPTIGAFEVTYQLRIRNNLPSGTTLSAAVLAAETLAPSSFLSSVPNGIQLRDLELTDDLTDPAFSGVTVTSLTNPTNGLTTNPGYNGDTDIQLLGPNAAIDAETDELLELTVQYTPDLSNLVWDNCAAGVDYLNQSTVRGTAAQVPIVDLSDDGPNPAPAADNGFGGVDDPTPVSFPCPPADLDIVKTVVPGPAGICPVGFDAGTEGPGAALPVTDGDTVTYCIVVKNDGFFPASNVAISDDQAPGGSFTIGTLAGGAEASRAYDVVATLTNPPTSQSITNVATVTGTSPDGPLSATDPAVINVGPLDEPVLQIVKTVVQGPNGTCPDFAGGTPGVGTPLPVQEFSTVTYCVSVLNVGLAQATNVVITDPQAPASFDGNVGTLAASNQATRSFDLRVVAATPPINVATADGVGPYGSVGPVSDNAAIVIGPGNPILDIVKTVIPGPNGTCPNFAGGTRGPGAPLGVLFGDSVTYCISVRNVGVSTATDVVVTDAQAPGPFSLGDIAAGAEAAAVSYDVLVTASTPSPNVNVAFADGQGPGGPIPQVDDDAVVNPIRPNDPVLAIVKTAIPGPNGTCSDFAGGTPGPGTAVPILLGDTVTFCISVQNTGLGNATGVVISDPQAPADFTIGNLAAGAEAAAVSYDVVVAASTPAVNTATVNGNGPNGAVAPSSDPALIAPTLRENPVLEIVKTVLPGPNATCGDFASGVPGRGTPLGVDLADTVTFCISVRNTGLGDATNVVVTDPQAPADITIGDLAAGDEITVSYDLAVANTLDEVNTATVNGQGPNGPTPLDSDTAVIDKLEPSLEIVKTVIPGPAGVCPDFANGVQGIGPALSVDYGDSVTYCLAIRNNGPGTATNVTITDAQAPEVYLIGSLAVGAETNRSYDLVVDETTNANNTGTVEGEGPNGPVPADSDMAQILPIPPGPPVLEIVKTVLPGPNATCPDFANGVDGPGPRLPVTMGQTVTYCMSIHNIGETNATNVVITDEQAPASFDGNVGDLAINAEVTRSFDLLVGADTEPRNTAIVNGDGPDGPVTQDSDDARIDPQSPLQPVLVIVKTVVAGPAGVCPSFDDGVVGPGTALPVNLGSTVTYCVSVRNTGAGDATNVVITDDQSSESPYDIGDLPAGETVTVSYDVVVGETTPLVNTARVTGNGPDGPVGPDDDTALIDPGPEPIPSISLTNTVIPTTESCDNAIEGTDEFIVGTQGEIVRWCFTITNTGNTPLTDIVFNDGPLELIDVDILAEYGDGANALLPGASITFSVDGPIPAIGIESDAAVAALPSDENGVVNPDLPAVEDVNDAAVAEAAIDLQKVVAAGANTPCAEAAEEIKVQTGADATWCFTVTNIGGVNLRVEEVTDDVLGITVPIPAAEQILVPGESVTVVHVGVIEGDVQNTAEVSGDPVDPNGDPFENPPVLEDDDGAVVLIFRADLSIIKTVSNSGPVDQGTLLTYTLAITNAGPDSAEDVVVVDDLPAGLSYVTLPVDSDWVCSESGNGRSLTCLKNSDLPTDTTVTLEYTVRVDATAPDSTTFVNTATVDSSTRDPDLSDNSDDADTSTTGGTPVVPVCVNGVDPACTSPPCILDQLGGTCDPEPEEPDEVLEELAFSGSSSALLALSAIAMAMTGGVLLVSGRRRQEDDEL